MRTYFDVVLGDREGVVCVAFGRKPFRNERDKYKHDDWAELTYAWPAEREKLAADVAREVATGDPVDIYVCPAVRNTWVQERAKGNAKPPAVLWTDLDDIPANVDLYAELVAAGSLVVPSGSDGHQHLYVPLAHPIDLGTFNRLNKALADKLGGDAKWPDNSLLRMPGTFNWKPTVPAAGQQAAHQVAVEIAAHTPGAHDPFKLAERLGVDLAAPAGTAAAERVAFSPEPVPDPLPGLVRHALSQPDSGDRSDDCARIVGACIDAGFTPGQALTVLQESGPAARYKRRAHMVDDVSRMYAKWSQSPGKGPQNPQNLGDAAGPGGSEGFEGGSPEEWAPPTPLPGRAARIPTDALGPVLQPFVESVGTALQVPTDLVVNLVLPIITTTAAGGWTVEPQPGWAEPLCLDTLSALPSGERKSPTLKVLIEPLRRFEKEAQREAAPRRAEQLAMKKLAEGQAEEARKKALKDVDGALEKEYLNLAAKHDALEVDLSPRWTCDDATPEAVVSLLADHRSIGVISAEPGLFGILAGKYSGGAPNIEWFLGATSGDTIKVDRKGRDAEDVENPALSMACCIQPGRLVELGKVKAFRDSGLLARLLYVVPQSAVGSRGRTSRVPEELAAEWQQRLTALAAAGQKRRAAPGLLPVDDDGQDALEELRVEIEPHLHPEHGRYAGIADWMNKLAGTTARIAAAITLLHDPEAAEVSGAAMRDAIRIGKAYVSHALVAFGLTRPDAELFSQAKQVLAVTRRLCLDAGAPTISRRAVHQKIRDRAWVENAESLAAPLDVLVEFGHLRAVVVQNPAGGRPSEHLELHPSHLVEVAAESAQSAEPPRSHSADSVDSVATSALPSCLGCEAARRAGVAGCGECYAAGRIDEDGRSTA